MYAQGLKPHKQALIYEDKKLYAFLASYPKTRGHIIVAWKKNVSDLSRMKKKHYQLLMNVVDRTRDAMLKVLKIKKVYLLYMDELNHVHWHLIPAYDEKGFLLLSHKPKKLSDHSLAKEIKKYFT